MTMSSCHCAVRNALLRVCFRTSRLTLQISSVVADAGDKNPCSLYFLNILIDTTVGALTGASQMC